MQAGDDQITIPVDSLAGTVGFIDTASLATANSTLVLASKNPKNNAPLRVIVPSSRLVLQADNRTFFWTKLATDTPYGANYQLQIVAVLANGTTRVSEIGEIGVLPDI